jgi:hypothetical protein
LLAPRNSGQSRLERFQALARLFDLVSQRTRLASPGEVQHDQDRKANQGRKTRVGANRGYVVLD